MIKIRSRQVGIALSFLALAFPCYAQQAQTSAQIMQEARNAGAASAAAIKNAIVTTNTAGTPTPSFASSNLSGQGQSLSAACRANPDEVGCAALNLGQDDHTARTAQAKPVTGNDASVQGARSVMQRPTDVTGTFNTAYSACAKENPTTGQKYTDTQSCFDYFFRNLGQVCQKNLQIDVTWWCNPGDGNPYPGPAGDGLQYCSHTELDALGKPKLDSAGKPIVTSYLANYSFIDYLVGCEGFDARVPPGLLLEEGDNSPPPPATGPGAPNKCERKNSVCSVPQETRYISGIPITAWCWQFTDTYDCLDLDGRSDCNQPRFGQCTQQGPAKCVDFDPLIPTMCQTWRKDFECETRNTTRVESIDNCTNQTFVDGQGNTWNVGHPPDKSFKRAVTVAEALREAGVSMTAEATVLSGQDNRCRKALFGLDNCCNRGGTFAFSALTDRALAALMGPAQLAGKDPIRDVSPYTYNALFPKAGNFITNLSIPTSLWAQMQLAIQLSGLIMCTDNEKSLATKRDAELCADIGEYCSRKTPIIGICTERTHTYCCFNSRLAKEINVQGKAQLGISMGSAQNPNCGGLSVGQFQQINLSKMNLSGFQDEISPYGVDYSAAVEQAKAAAQNSGSSPDARKANSKSSLAAPTASPTKNKPSVESCFFGAGKC